MKLNLFEKTFNNLLNRNLSVQCLLGLATVIGFAAPSYAVCELGEERTERLTSQTVRVGASEKAGRRRTRESIYTPGTGWAIVSFDWQKGGGYRDGSAYTYFNSEGNAQSVATRQYINQEFERYYKAEGSGSAGGRSGQGNVEIRQLERNLLDNFSAVRTDGVSLVYGIEIIQDSAWKNRSSGASGTVTIRCVGTPEQITRYIDNQIAEIEASRPVSTNNSTTYSNPRSQAGDALLDATPWEWNGQYPETQALQSGANYACQHISGKSRATNYVVDKSGREGAGRWRWRETTRQWEWCEFCQWSFSSISCI